ncbi:MAG: prenyltransferase/squalene oxidase repeat-containing protein [Acidobacteriota bacterium]|nr:prenyltransferase/squalene oxidase repeat-containing protein [Acidobacteriota bacterium]
MTIVSILKAAAGMPPVPLAAVEPTQSAQAPVADEGASRLLADPYYAPFFEAASVQPYSRDVAYAESFSVERASQFLDRVAVGWGETYRCVTCHTNGYYLTAPTAIFGDRPAFSVARQHAADFVESWDAPLPPVPEHDGEEVEDIYTYTVATAAFLAINDAQAQRELSRATVTALDRAWAIQDEKGHWPGWIKCNWPPFETDDHFGVTLMAIAVGMAPDRYAQREQVQVGMQRIRNYVANNPPEQRHHKAMLLWAARFNADLLSETQRRVWTEELLDLQRPDGGWASGDLGDWKQREGGPVDPPVNAESDGYGTGFVMYTLRQGGVPATDERLQRGVDWLKTHQRAAGYWWTQSLRNNPTTPNFLTHTGTTFALKALASMGAL